jgi:hypothetical protein
LIARSRLGVPTVGGRNAKVSPCYS